MRRARRLLYGLPKARTRVDPQWPQIRAAVANATAALEGVRAIPLTGFPWRELQSAYLCAAANGKISNMVEVCCVFTIFFRDFGTETVLYLNVLVYATDPSL